MSSNPLDGLFPNGIPGASTTDNAKPEEKPADATTSSETKGEQPKVEEKPAEVKTPSTPPPPNNDGEEEATPPEESEPSKDDRINALKTEATEIIERMKSNADVSITDATSTVFELHENSYQRQDATEVAHKLNNTLLEHVGNDSSRIKEYFEAIVMIAENVEEKSFEFFLLGPLAYRLKQLLEHLEENPQKFYNNGLYRRHKAAMFKIMNMRSTYETVRDFIPFCMGDKEREIYPRNLNGALTNKRLNKQFSREELETHLEMLKYMLSNGEKPESELDEQSRQLRISHDGQRRRAEWIVKRLEKFLHGAPDTRLGKAKINIKNVAEELLKKRSSARNDNNTAKDNTSRAETSGQQEDEIMEVQSLKAVFDRHNVPYGFLQEVDQLKGFPDKLDFLHADVIALQMQTERGKKLRDVALVTINKAKEIVKATPPRNAGNDRRRSDPPPAPDRKIAQQSKLDAILTEHMVLIAGRVSSPELWQLEGMFEKVSDLKKSEGFIDRDVWSAWMEIHKLASAEQRRRDESRGPRKSPSGDKHKAAAPKPEETPKDASPKGGVDKLDAVKSEAELVGVLTPLGVSNAAQLYRNVARGESQARYEARVVKAVGSVKDIDKLDQIRGDLYELKARLHESTIDSAEMFLTELQRVVDAAAKAEAKKETKTETPNVNAAEDPYKGDPLKRAVMGMFNWFKK